MPTIVRFPRLGSPVNFRFEEIESQQPGKGEVRLRVQATGLNRAESMYYRGTYLEQPQLPSRLGFEAAGVVEAVGEGVDPSWIGKPVATVPGFSQNRYGTLGEEAIVPVEVLGEYPPNLTPVQAAAIWMQYLTAYGALVHLGGVGPGDFVSIPAASSSVGLAAIQIVHDAGAKSIALTRNRDKRAELLACGADHAIVVGEEGYVAAAMEITGGQGVRLTFDPVGGPFIDLLAEASAQGGAIFVYGWLSEEPTPFPLLQALSRGVSVRGYTVREITANPDLLEEAKRFLCTRLADGRLTPKIAKTFPFSETVEAYRFLESNQQVGKIVITVP
jgi:NADPH:quinone reductase-like Zn-dependent oxidoreductase